VSRSSLRVAEIDFEEGSEWGIIKIEDGAICQLL